MEFQRCRRSGVGTSSTGLPELEGLSYGAPGGVYEDNYYTVSFCFSFLNDLSRRRRSWIFDIIVVFFLRHFHLNQERPERRGREGEPKDKKIGRAHV